MALYEQNGNNTFVASEVFPEAAEIIARFGISNQEVKHHWADDSDFLHDLSEFGFRDSRELMASCLACLEPAIERNKAFGDVERLLSVRHITWACADWDFLASLWSRLVEDGVEPERLASSLASSVADNMVRQAAADIDLTSGEFRTRIYEGIEVADFCPDMTFGREPSDREECRD